MGYYTDEDLQNIVTYMAEDIARGMAEELDSRRTITNGGHPDESMTHEAIRTLVVGSAVNTCNHFKTHPGMSTGPQSGKPRKKDRGRF